MVNSIVGLELNIDALEKQIQIYEAKAITSNFNANNININTTNNTLIKDATIKADNQINIETTNLEVVSVQDNSKTKTNSKGVNLGAVGGGIA